MSLLSLICYIPVFLSSMMGIIILDSVTVLCMVTITTVILRYLKNNEWQKDVAGKSFGITYQE